MQTRWPSEFRLIAYAATFVALAGLVIYRLGQLQVGSHDKYVDRASMQQFKRVVVQPQRGDILDTKGRVLATSIARTSVYLQPKKLPGGDPTSWAGVISEAAGIEYTKAIDLLRKDRPVLIARRLDAAGAARFDALCDQYDLPDSAIWFHRESQRTYPRAVAPHIIGYTSTDGDGDNRGASGIELEADAELRGQKIEQRLERAASRVVLGTMDEAVFDQARGETLMLTIDAALQESVERSVANHVAKHNADSAYVVVMETRTGAIRAMACYPTFDNNTFNRATDAQRRNRCITDPFEPGSCMKIMTMAILFDLGLANPDELIDCENGSAVVEGRRLKDSGGHHMGVVSLREVFRFSSNVGTIKAGMRIPKNQYYDSLRLLGFGQKTGIDLPGEGGGILHPLNKWTRLSLSSLPMGYEIATTALQVTTVTNGILNNGVMMKPYVVAERRDARGHVLWRAQPEALRQIVRPSTTMLIRDLLEDAVVNGTGKNAQVPGYRVGGKTGTTRLSQKLDKRQYIASFTGAVPIDNPEFTIFCSVDNPKGEFYYAGDVAAPLFRDVATAALTQFAIASTGAPRPSEKQIARGLAGGDVLDADSLAAGATPGPSDLAPKGLATAEAITLASPRVMTGRGEMPDLHGMTFAEARTALRDSKVEVKFTGTGLVVDQYPSPGTPLENVPRALVILENTELRMKRLQGGVATRLADTPVLAADNAAPPRN